MLIGIVRDDDDVESDYAEVNSDRVAYRMIKPGLVAEISCLDVISTTSHGSTIERMVVAWNRDKQFWKGVRRLPLCSIISPQFVCLRDDKQFVVSDAGIEQLHSIVNIPTSEQGKLYSLNHEICVSDSEQQIRELFAEWKKRYYKRGWKEL